MQNPINPPLYGFWSIDKEPYFKGDQIQTITDDGKITVKHDIDPHAPVCIVPLKEGKKLHLKLLQEWEKPRHCDQIYAMNFYHLPTISFVVMKTRVKAMITAMLSHMTKKINPTDDKEYENIGHLRWDAKNSQWLIGPRPTNAKYIHNIAPTACLIVLSTENDPHAKGW